MQPNKHDPKGGAGGCLPSCPVLLSLTKECIEWWLCLLGKHQSRCSNARITTSTCSLSINPPPTQKGIIFPNLHQQRHEPHLYRSLYITPFEFCGAVRASWWRNNSVLRWNVRVLFMPSVILNASVCCGKCCGKTLLYTNMRLETWQKWGTLSFKLLMELRIYQEHRCCCVNVNCECWTSGMWTTQNMNSQFVLTDAVCM